MAHLFHEEKKKKSINNFRFNFYIIDCFLSHSMLLIDDGKDRKNANVLVNRRTKDFLFHTFSHVLNIYEIADTKEDPLLDGDKEEIQSEPSSGTNDELTLNLNDHFYQLLYSVDLKCN